MAPNFGARPAWLFDEDDVPLSISGARFHAVPFSYGPDGFGAFSAKPAESGGLAPLPAVPQLPPDFAPHLRFTPQIMRRELESFQQLHRHCLHTNQALTCSTSISTPNLEWRLLLVAGHYTPDAAAPATAPATPAPGGGAAAAGTAAQPQVTQHAPPPPRAPPTKICFLAYFLPYSPALDVRQGQCMWQSWAQRRLRGADAAAIRRWRDERRCYPTDALTGLPLAEPRVCIRSYSQRAASAAAASAAATAAGGSSSGGGYSTFSSGVGSGADAGGGGGGGYGMHTSLVEGVPAGGVFQYVTRPWLVRNAALREAITSDLLPEFLTECDCAPAECGKLKARQELRRLRAEGVAYGLEVQPLAMQAGRRDLGLFAAEELPGGCLLMEYVGEWLTEEEAEAREARYQAAGLHYMYDLQLLCAPPSPTRRPGPGGEQLPAAVDATALGNAARFLNHHCEDANVETVNVCSGGLREAAMVICFRTTRRISPGEQLLLNYVAHIRDEAQRAAIRADPQGLVACRCGAASCLRVVFPSNEAQRRPEGHTAVRRGGGGGGAGAGISTGANLSPGSGTDSPSFASAASGSQDGRSEDGRNGREVAAHADRQQQREEGAGEEGQRQEGPRRHDDQPGAAAAAAQAGSAEDSQPSEFRSEGTAVGGRVHVESAASEPVVGRAAAAGGEAPAGGPGGQHAAAAGGEAATDGPRLHEEEARGGEGEAAAARTKVTARLGSGGASATAPSDRPVKRRRVVTVTLTDSSSDEAGDAEGPSCGGGGAGERRGRGIDGGGRSAGGVAEAGHGARLGERRDAAAPGAAAPVQSAVAAQQPAALAVADAAEHAVVAVHEEAEDEGEDEVEVIALLSDDEDDAGCLTGAGGTRQAAGREVSVGVAGAATLLSASFALVTPKPGPAVPGARGAVSDALPRVVDGGGARAGAGAGAGAGAAGGDDDGSGSEGECWVY
ncbi:hypothetical protein HXX76_009389 [Chlamydomonas incerta]|uniref:SET domain-containing protein n=1 Tax=Chlamydomonas incerta TaxID=51695 RepID=A0A835SUR1_CHLIN|nr:hypothetical protein HXX76_009389 [Chlamydomonas incerta]|eukprot:KAG2431897.1 hypothetical protein HXX76_009389 [Chlamydomonas incerta]